MEFVGYEELAGRPSIVVDGTPAPGTVLTLSHWKGSGTPSELADDLSTQIAFRYLDRPDMHVSAEAVSNNHFDEDGVCGIFVVLHPDIALPLREQIIDVASAGDFGVFRDRDSARVSMILMAFEDEARSPLPASSFAKPYNDLAGDVYRETLALLPEMINNPARWKSLWEDEDAYLDRTEAAIRSGTVAITEHPHVDLAIVRADAQPHAMAINTATPLHRVLTVVGRRYRLQYRYETWVNFVSRPVQPRAELGPLAERLNHKDSVRWTAGNIGSLTPALEHTGESALEPNAAIEAIVGYLSEAV